MEQTVKKKRGRQPCLLSDTEKKLLINYVVRFPDYTWPTVKETHQTAACVDCTSGINIHMHDAYKGMLWIGINLVSEASGIVFSTREDEPAFRTRTFAYHYEMKNILKGSLQVDEKVYEKCKQTHAYINKLLLRLNNLNEKVRDKYAD